MQSSNIAYSWSPSLHQHWWPGSWYCYNWRCKFQYNVLSLFASLSMILTNLTLTQDHVLRLDSNSKVLHFVLFFFLIQHPDIRRIKWTQKWVPRYVYQHVYVPLVYCLVSSFPIFASFIFLHHHHHHHHHHHRHHHNRHHHPHQKARHLY